MYSHITMKMPIHFGKIGLLLNSEVTQMNGNYLSSIWTKDLWEKEFQYLKIEKFRSQ